MSPKDLLSRLRHEYHLDLIENKVLTVNDKEVPSNADKDSPSSVKIANFIIKRIGMRTEANRLAGQISGSQFETICAEFLKKSFLELHHLRPGNWEIGKFRGKIHNYDQYEHMDELERATLKNPDLRAALGSDYLIKPDIVILRYPEEDKNINRPEKIVGENVARKTSLRKINNEKPILHASISCKWTMRSDRAQNVRSEALNMVRNRKGRLPHITAVTGEPLPHRIASVALGTGDIDCVYHFALDELKEAVTALDFKNSKEMLETMINGKRLRDIADLPLDLVV